MKIIYYLFLKPLIALPWPVLYLVSDFLYLIGYGIFRYRVSIVNQNLENSFPEKNSKERAKIRRKFYRHFFDVILESIKISGETEEQIRQKCHFKNPELIDSLTGKGRDVILVGGHYNNWEIMCYPLDRLVNDQVVAIYHQFKNKFFEKKMREARGSLGVHLVSRSELREGALNTLTKRLIIIFLADQSPTIAKRVYWTQFLNQETAVAYGTEIYALRKNAAVVYFQNKKVERGRYEITFKLLSEFPKEEPRGAITEKHVRALEEDILAEPQYWLWTHKRWKRKRNQDIE